MAFVENDVARIIVLLGLAQLANCICRVLDRLLTGRRDQDDANTHGSPKHGVIYENNLAGRIDVASRLVEGIAVCVDPTVEPDWI